jgi:hypothetical protein
VSDPTPENTAKLEEAMGSPKHAQDDQGAVTARSAADLIALDRHLAGKRAQASGRSGLRQRKMRGPSAL